MKIVAMVGDLMDRSRFGSREIEFVDAAALLPICAIGADLVVVDLSRPGALDVLDALVESAGRVIGYAPHVDSDLLQAAAAAGVVAMPRSKLFRSLDEVLDSA